VTIGHHPENLGKADLVVVSSAIPHSNCEFRAAQTRKIPVLPRAALLARLAQKKKSIAVAGTHGKTTTTSMISLLLEANGLDPTFLIGGELNDIGTGARYGKGDLFVAEMDESDGSFLYLNPEIIVLTNIEADHLDFYGSFENVETAFLKFVSRLPEQGYAIICRDLPNMINLIKRVGKRCYTYGLGEESDFQAKNIRLESFGSYFEVYQKDVRMGEVKLKVPGLHNVYNALAAIVLGNSLGLDFPKISQALGQFSGVQRRFEVVGSVSEIMIIDDYAHHPTEVKATLEAAKNGGFQRLICIFQPHRYSRTKFLEKEFGEAFDQADLLIMTDVYPAGEEPLPGVSGKLLVDSVLKKRPGKQVIYLPNKSHLVDFLHQIVKPKDVILTMGAGDIWTVGKEFLEHRGGRSL